MLAEMEQILVEREDRTARLAADLADYLESRRRAYAILSRRRSPDDLHGPLDAPTLLAASNRVLARLQSLSVELTRALGPLTALQGSDRVAATEVEELEVSEPGSARLAARRQSLTTLEVEWESRDRARPPPPGRARSAPRRGRAHPDRDGSRREQHPPVGHAGRAGPHPHRAPRDLAAAVGTLIRAVAPFAAQADYTASDDPFAGDDAAKIRRPERAFR